jgi:hypothetical protein
MDCIAFIREQRIPPMTFLPVQTIKVGRRGSGCHGLWLLVVLKLYHVPPRFLGSCVCGGGIMSHQGSWEVVCVGGYHVPPRFLGSARWHGAW